MHQGARYQAYHRSLADAWNAQTGSYDALFQWTPAI